MSETLRSGWGQLGLSQNAPHLRTADEDHGQGEEEGRGDNDIN